MDSARWDRIQSLFHAALDRPQRERAAWLDTACTDDASLAAEVTAMLEADVQTSPLLDGEVATTAHRMLAGNVPTALAGERFGPYRIERMLGEGGMGVVYLAVRDDIGSTAAIKILRDAWLSPARRDRFASEQRTLAQLNHPSIAHLFDAGSLGDGTPWFVMEYVEGVPITTHIATAGSSVAERLQLFRAVCEAVQHAHSHLVVHRDLKPSNILVKPDSTVKLLDFGIAKQLDSLDVAADQTQTGLRLMTPAYAAPEQLRGGRVGVHTDVYSLGVLLYEMLTGRLPFDLSSHTPAESGALIEQQSPPKPSVMARTRVARLGQEARVASASATSWSDLDVLVLTAMHKEPDRRYRTVDALLRDIDHYLAGEPLEARPDSLRYRASKFVRRNRRAVVATAATIAALIGLVVFYTVRLRSARNAAVANAARTERIQKFMTTLFDGGDASVGPADSLRVVTVVDRGVQEARALDAEPAVQAELYETLGGIYQKLGNLERADTLLQTAYTQRVRLFGESHVDVARSLVALGLLRSAQARYEDAERMIRQALAMETRLLTPDDPMIPGTMASLGQVLDLRGSYDQAVAILEKAAQLQSKPGMSTADLSETLTELANCHFYLAHYGVSDSLNRRVLAMDRTLYGERHPHVADDLINLGAIQYQRGDFKDAERYYRQALDIITSFYGRDHQETASAMTMLARALVSEERFAEAGDMLREAVGVQERVYGPVHPRVASALNELGKVAQRQGRYDDARAQFARMADIYRTSYGDKHYLIGVALSNLASVYYEEKEYAKAEALFRDVLRRYGETLASDHENVGMARIKLGRTLARENRYADAERELTAGMAIMAKQETPLAAWMTSARKELVNVYTALNKPTELAAVRVQLADSSK